MTDTPQKLTIQTYAAHGMPAVVADERAQLIELGAWLSALKADHDALQARLNGQILHQHGDSLGELDRKAAEIEATHEAIGDLAARHPEWFAAGETIQSRFGTLKRTTGQPLDIADEDVTVAAIKGLPKALHAGLLHTTIRPDKEALAKLPDAELRPLGVTRSMTVKFTFTPKPLTPAAAGEKKPRRPKAKAAAPQKPEVAHA